MTQNEFDELVESLRGDNRWAHPFVLADAYGIAHDDWIAMMKAHNKWVEDKWLDDYAKRQGAVYADAKTEVHRARMAASDAAGRVPASNVTEAPKNTVGHGKSHPKYQAKVSDMAPRPADAQVKAKTDESLHTKPAKTTAEPKTATNARSAATDRPDKPTNAKTTAKRPSKPKKVVKKAERRPIEDGYRRRTCTEGRSRREKAASFSAFHDYMASARRRGLVAA